jgi:transposase-like protein
MTTDRRTLLESVANLTDGAFLRELVGWGCQRLMELDVQGLCNAEPNERTDERVNQRNGYRDRRWETRAGTIDLKVPKRRKGRRPRRGHPGGLDQRRLDPRR